MAIGPDVVSKPSIEELTRQLARALAERDEVRAQQAATSSVLKEISRSTFDLTKVLQSLLDSAMNLGKATTGGMFLPDSDGGYRMAVLAGEGLQGNRVELALEKTLRDRPIRPGHDTTTGIALLERRTVHTPDISAMPGYRPDIVAVGAYRTNLAVPMMRDGDVVGVIVLTRGGAVSPFTDRQIELVETFAAQAVIAIGNVRLFNETREALARQTATAEILKVIASSPADVQPVFDAIAERARLLCGAQVGSATRFDGEWLHMLSYKGASPQAEAEMRAAFPVRPGHGSVNARAIVTAAPAQVPDIQLDPNYQLSGPVARAGLRSMLGVPMVQNGRVIGVIGLGREVPGPYSDNSIALVQTFADQAVIAIENVRLFTELRDSLQRLKAAQASLIQAEKLASLGQLTAGIAHEIKNPLNFVNNFADLSAELVGELREALDPARTELGAEARADVDELTEMLTANLAKVSRHGRRADSIVKNMLLHSREGGGERRRVDLNASVEESLNLAYHGARAEKPGFNMTLEKDLDPALGEVELYPQEFVRVLLNLISNGFYAAHQRKIDSADAAFEPTLRVTTRALGDRAEIRIRDNGTGIPDAMKEKIFNPFFTTKPAGEGTGLGLSLSYDIVVKQHGGTIDVETEPGAFTEFVVTVPRQLAAGAAPATVRSP